MLAMPKCQLSGRQKGAMLEMKNQAVVVKVEPLQQMFDP